MSTNPSRVEAQVWETKRRLLFFIVALLALALILVGIRLGDPETIHRFSAQI
jgi:hypothetical protein